MLEQLYSNTLCTDVYFCLLSYKRVLVLQYVKNVLIRFIFPKIKNDKCCWLWIYILLKVNEWIIIGKSLRQYVICCGCDCMNSVDFLLPQPQHIIFGYSVCFVCNSANFAMEKCEGHLKNTCNIFNTAIAKKKWHGCVSTKRNNYQSIGIEKQAFRLHKAQFSCHAEIGKGK